MRGKQSPRVAHVDTLEPNRRSFRQAWSGYIRGGVVSKEAVRMIVQAMAACCGKSRRDNEAEEETERRPQTCPPSDMQELVAF